MKFLIVNFVLVDYLLYLNIVNTLDLKVNKNEGLMSLVFKVGICNIICKEMYSCIWNKVSLFMSCRLVVMSGTRRLYVVVIFK